MRSYDMPCKDCGAVHPRTEMHNPHYCIARMSEEIERIRERTNTAIEFLDECLSSCECVAFGLERHFCDSFGCGTLLEIKRKLEGKP